MVNPMLKDIKRKAGGNFFNEQLLQLQMYKDEG